MTTASYNRRRNRPASTRRRFLASVTKVRPKFPSQDQAIAVFAPRVYPGFVTTKTAELESVEALQHKFDEASKHADLG
jgi:hypothetical protein